MNIRSLPFVPLAALFFATVISPGGCSSTVYVTFDGLKDSLSYMEFNEEVALEKLSVFSSHGYTRTARDFRVAPDSCMWIDAVTGMTLHAPIFDIKSAVHTDHLRGLWTYFVIGGLAGYGLGSAVVSMSEGYKDDRLARALMPMASCAVGAMSGGLFGVIRGYDYSFFFKPYAGGATVVYLHDGSRIIGTIEEIVPEKHIVMRTWDGDRIVVDQALIMRIDDPSK